jgi:hypothetical protein
MIDFTADIIFFIALDQKYPPQKLAFAICEHYFRNGILILPSNDSCFDNISKESDYVITKIDHDLNSKTIKKYLNYRRKIFITYKNDALISNKHKIQKIEYRAEMRHGMIWYTLYQDRFKLATLSIDNKYNNTRLIKNFKLAVRRKTIKLLMND